jgi:hypothetical protein
MHGEAVGIGSGLGVTPRSRSATCSSPVSWLYCKRLMEALAEARTEAPAMAKAVPAE